MSYKTMYVIPSHLFETLSKQMNSKQLENVKLLNKIKPNSDCFLQTGAGDSKVEEENIKKDKGNYKAASFASNHLFEKHQSKVHENNEPEKKKEKRKKTVSNKNEVLHQTFNQTMDEIDAIPSSNSEGHTNVKHEKKRPPSNLDIHGTAVKKAVNDAILKLNQLERQ